MGTATASPARLKQHSQGLTGAPMTVPTPEYRELPLSRGLVSLVDDADYDWLSQWRWHVCYCPQMRSFYARREFKDNGKRHTLHLHREICALKPKDGLVVDHANHDTLDNRRSNLRVVTQRANSWNRQRNRDSVTGFKGVSFQPKRNIYQARINFCGNKMSLGYFRTPEEAAAAYRDASKRLFGEFSFTAESPS